MLLGRRVRAACAAAPGAPQARLWPSQLCTWRGACMASGTDEGAAWTAALQQQQQQQTGGAGERTLLPDALLPTPHPAVGAGAREAAAWEAALAPRAGAAAAAACPLVAAVELGSHSTRLLIVSSDGADVVRLTRDTHLGAASALDGGGPTLAALREFRAALDEHRPAATAAVATAAVREAPDASALLGEAARVLGLGCPVRVLAGAEEAALAFAGATAGLASSSAAVLPCLVFDLGGRSTELAVGLAGQPALHTASVPLGCLGVAATAGGATAPAQELLRAADAVLGAAAATVDGVLRAWAGLRQQHAAASSPPAVVGAGGTITSLAAALRRLPTYDRRAVHHSRLDAAQLAALLPELAAAGGAAWASPACEPWLTARRASTLAPGAAALAALLRRLGADSVLHRPPPAMADKDAAKKPEPSSLEDDDFEEFGGVPEDVAAKEGEAAKDLWQADWDDEDTAADFASQLKQELASSQMKE
ncbi:gppA [Scenedesmus sp. PABB004]|nr:gppA [Scenedesmus sp. PABB004]